MPVPDHVLESERAMAKDVRENPGLYAALAGVSPNDADEAADAEADDDT